MNVPSISTKAGSEIQEVSERSGNPKSLPP